MSTRRNEKIDIVDGIVDKLGGDDKIVDSA